MEDWEISPESAERFERIGHEFLAEFLEVERGLRPGNLDALVELGHVYTRLGRYEDGLEIDEELARRLPHNPTVLYNLACSLALLERREEAVQALEEAVRCGFDDLELLQRDGDLDNLRELPAFQTLLSSLRG